jgi:hypothetical protein
VWVGRLRPDGKIVPIWTTDLDHESMEAFWRKNPVDPADV